MREIRENTDQNKLREMRENMDQNNSEYRYFSRSLCFHNRQHAYVFFKPLKLKHFIKTSH